MPALDEAARIFAPGTTEIYFCPTVANRSAPTRAELTTTGTNLSAQIADLAGWSTTGGEIDTPNLRDVFVSKIPGRVTAEDSSLTCYFGEDGEDVRDLWDRGTAGFIVIVDAGLKTTASPCEVFPVRVRSISVQRSMGEEPSRILAQFSITALPTQDALIPAAP